MPHGRPVRPTAVEVRHAALGDEASLVRLRHALWPDGSEAEHRQEVERFLAEPGRRGAVLVAEGQSSLLGFAEVSSAHTPWASLRSASFAASARTCSRMQEATQRRDAGRANGLGGRLLNVSDEER